MQKDTISYDSRIPLGLSNTLGSVPCVPREEYQEDLKSPEKPARNRNTIPLSCAKCSIQFLGRHAKKNASPNRFCSRSCAISFRNSQATGPNNPNWRGGVSQDNYHYKKLQRQRYPEKVAAREAVHRATRSGKLLRTLRSMRGYKDRCSS